MNQVDLMVKCQNLEPGQCFNLPDEEMAEAADGIIDSLLLNGSARGADKRLLANQMQKNWGVQVSYREMAAMWVVCKPDPDRQTMRWEYK